MASSTLTKNEYELTVLIKPTVSEKNVDKVLDQITTNLKNQGADITNVEDPVHKRLAQKLKGFKDCYFTTFFFKSGPELPIAMNRTLLIMDEVIRHALIKKENKGKDKKESKKDESK